MKEHILCNFNYFKKRIQKSKSFYQIVNSLPIRKSRIMCLTRAIYRVLGKKLSSIILNQINGSVELKSYRLKVKLKIDRSIDHYTDLIIDGLKTWEKESQKIWICLARSCDVIVDVGSYVGFYSLLAEKANINAKIFAFEPNPYTFTLLQDNLNLNNSTNIEVFNSGLGNTSEILTLYIPSDRLKSSKSSFKIKAATNILSNVAVLRLDSILSQVDLIKIDAEGFELKVLEGSSKILKFSKPKLMIEILHRADYVLIQNFLTQYMYRCFFVDLLQYGHSTFPNDFKGRGNYFFS
jgi:FkbM family methyltransferase